MNIRILLALVLSFPSVALACGGLFCNSAMPVNQAAERILFAADGDTMHMHVRLTYQGPPAEFGWLLPAPLDVETQLSSETLFSQLDINFAPIFRLTTEFEEGCLLQPSAQGNNVDFAEEGGGGGGGVNVLSRENVGPYDRAILVPESIEVLRAWLDENGYQIPEATDEKLQPYLDMGSAFVAIKLLPDAGTSDIVPLHLSFTSPNPAIPIIPTAVAADPDMGLIVHILGASRAIPRNYRHVQINETAIDWGGNGSNYADVVSQAADEAGGRAFATDFAGPHEGNLNLPLVSADTLARIEATESPSVAAAELFPQAVNGFGNLDADLQRVFLDTVELPEEVTLFDLAQHASRGDGVMPIEGVVWDKADLMRRLAEEINAPREHLDGLFGANPYLSRLYSTLSPNEMTVDPMFDSNPDLDPVPNVRQATQFVSCVNGEPDFGDAIIETPSGLRFKPSALGDEGVITRQNGETVRGQEVIAAMIVEQHLGAGQPELLEDHRGTIIADNFVNATGGAGGGCNCDVAATEGPNPWAFLVALCLLGLRRRRV